MNLPKLQRTSLFTKPIRPVRWLLQRARDRGSQRYAGGVNLTTYHGTYQVFRRLLVFCSLAPVGLQRIERER